MSFFRNIGKSFFLNVLFQHATFISSGDPPGTLADICTEEGFWAFVRLVGTAYFKKHVSAFRATIPEALTEATSTAQLHQKWLEEIRKRVWERTVTTSPLMRHSNYTGEGQ